MSVIQLTCSAGEVRRDMVPKLPYLESRPRCDLNAERPVAKNKMMCLMFCLKFDFTKKKSQNFTSVKLKII